MIRTLGLSVSTAVLACSLSAGVYAQDNAANSGSSSAPKSAKDVTCAELSSMDTATVPGVLYFVAGYSEGERSAGQSGMSGNGQSSDSDSSDSSAGSSGSDSSASDSTDTNTNASESSSEAGSSGTDAMQSGDSSASATSGANVQIGRLTGYFDIPVQDIVVACESDPDRTISEILTERNTGLGSSTSESSTSGSSSGSGSSQ